MKLKKVLMMMAVCATAMIVASCGGSSETAQLGPLETVSFADTLIIGETEVIQSITVCYPAKDDRSVVADSLRMYYSNELRSLRDPNILFQDTPDSLPLFSGDICDGKALLSYYGSAGFENMRAVAEHGMAEWLEYNQAEAEEGEEPQSIPGYMFSNMNEVTFSVEDSTESYITLKCDQYFYTGGAHPNNSLFFTTFDLQNGHRMGYNLIDTVTYKAELYEFIKEGMKEYVADMCPDEFPDGVVSEAQLAEQLTWWADDSSGEMKVNVQFPTAEPSLTKNGVLFMYQAYEVAPYAFGRPGVTVPYEKIKPYMTPEGRKLIEREK